MIEEVSDCFDMERGEIVVARFVVFLNGGEVAICASYASSAVELSLASLVSVCVGEEERGRFGGF